MVLRTTLRWMLVLGMAAAASACTDQKPTAGPDPGTDSNARMITWSDGKEAIEITCGMPGGCQSRANAMCQARYNVLKMDNMPTRGDATVVRGSATVVVRCA